MGFVIEFDPKDWRDGNPRDKMSKEELYKIQILDAMNQLKSMIDFLEGKKNNNEKVIDIDYVYYPLVGLLSGLDCCINDPKEEKQK